MIRLVHRHLSLPSYSLIDWHRKNVFECKLFLVQPVNSFNQCTNAEWNVRSISLASFKYAEIRLNGEWMSHDWRSFNYTQIGAVVRILFVFCFCFQQVDLPGDILKLAKDFGGAESNEIFKYPSPVWNAISVWIMNYVCWIQCSPNCQWVPSA